MTVTLEQHLQSRVLRDASPVPLSVPVPVEALPTPALIVDVARMERNLTRMADHLAARGVGLRPHAKMHKCPEVARRQLALGAIGVCCAKVAEAEVMRAAGIERILVTSPVAADEAIGRLVALAARSEDVRVVVDCADAAARLGAAAVAAGTTVSVLIDLDPEMGRTGIARGEPALALARTIATTAGLRLTGLQQYAGQLQHLKDSAERREKSRAAMEAGLATRDLIVADGHPLEVFTGGGTGTYDIDSEVPGVTDLQCGSYVFMDEEYAAIGHGNGDRFEVFEPALFVLVTAISQPRAGLITVDGGYKSFASDTVRPVAADLPGLRYHFGGDEHGIVQLGEGAPALTVGDRIRMVTPHCDPTINLYDWIYPVVDGQVHELWPIAARGCSW
ncbi:MAG TPA: DSD1 family PLP-dependent enzyme [Pseudomonadales bacterium]|nr:DSD1 family PLP-dependent enzyme [Pseudomonadales bacterium]